MDGQEMAHYFVAMIDILGFSHLVEHSLDSSAEGKVCVLAPVWRCTGLQR